MLVEQFVFVNQFKLYYYQSFQALAEQYELQMLDIDLLLFVYNNPSLNTARDAVALRGLSKSNVSTSLCKLRMRGFLLLQTDPGNRRLQHIFLLPEGEAVARELRACQKACFERLFTGFSDEELSQLRQYLTRLNGNITAAIRDKNRKDTKQCF